MDFAGSHIAVTGASSGIGLVTGKPLGERDARVSPIVRHKKRSKAKIALSRAAARRGATA